MDEKKRMQIIAENITHFRKQRGITQKELAKEVGITASTMTDYMKLRSAPSFGVIQKLADYFGVKKSDIDTTFKEESTNSLPDAPDSLTQQIMDKVVQLTPPNQKIVLRTSEELLESQNEEETKINEVSEVISLYQVEVVSETAAACGFNYGFGYDDTDRETIEVDERPPRHDIATKVSGDSMQPTTRRRHSLFSRQRTDYLQRRFSSYRIWRPFLLQEDIYRKRTLTPSVTQ